MKFVPRLTIPEKGNKYYNRVPEGYGTSIQGYPLQSGLTVLSNCVGYAAARFNEIGGYGKWMFFNYPPNAEDFWTREPRLKRGQEPKLGAIIVWEGVGSKAGHVAIVEQINSDGSITTSESGYGCAKPFWTSRRTKGNGNWGAGNDYKFLGFIYQPEEQITLPIVAPATRTIKKGDRGDDVKALQTRLVELGYLRANEVDGDFGKITLGAVLAFQLETGLAVDGVAGKYTKEALGL